VDQLAGLPILKVSSKLRVRERGGGGFIRNGLEKVGTFFWVRRAISERGGSVDSGKNSYRSEVHLRGKNSPEEMKDSLGRKGQEVTCRCSGEKNSAEKLVVCGIETDL